MRILVINHLCKTLEVVTLDKDEAAYLMEGVGLDIQEADLVRDILEKRGFDIGDFNPTWMVLDDGDGVPVFDETHQEEPLITL